MDGDGHFNTATILFILGMFLGARPAFSPRQVINLRLPPRQVDTISGTPGYACPIYARTGQVTEFSEVRGRMQKWRQFSRLLFPISACV